LGVKEVPSWETALCYEQRNVYDTMAETQSLTHVSKYGSYITENNTVSTTNTNMLMPFREIIAVYSGNYTQHALDGISVLSATL
jgi:hypothetical protein